MSQALDRSEMASGHAEATTESTIRFRISGMDCASCAQKIDIAVRRVHGVRDVSVSVGTRTLTVAHDGMLPPKAIERQVTGLGYGITDLDAPAVGQSHGGTHSVVDADDGPWWSSRKAKRTIGCGITLVIAYAIGQLAPETSCWIFLLALAAGLIPIAQRAISAAWAGTPFSIETLMCIAAIGAVMIGETEEAAVVVLLFLIGEFLEGMAAGRARASISNLTKLVPKTAFVERNGKTEEVPAEALVIGSLILVRPGDRIPADGVILSGESAVDEAPVTGESTPKQKRAEDAVFAGTVNLDGAIRVRVAAEAQDNTIARVVKLVEEAQEAKAPTERFIDQFSRYYTPAVIVVAALVAVVPPLLLGASWNEWVYKGLAVLLIGCPCALVISTPAAIAAGLSVGARRGLLMKGGGVLEQLGRITVAAFDKTGTLTEGKPEVTDVIGIGRSERDIVSLAAALETGSSHPLAKAILAHAASIKAPVPPAASMTALAGKGVTGRVGRLELFLGSPQAAAERVSLGDQEMTLITELNEQGKTVSVLLAGDKVAGLIAMRDEPRPDARSGLEALRRAGVSVLMVTGDNRRTAEAIGQSLGIEPRAELLPEDKQWIVRELQAKGEVVAKIGDGINDAPGLAAADVGIAMGGGADVALETADAAALHGRVMDVAHMVSLSRQTMANIRQNIIIALGLKAIFLVTTIVGMTGLWPAILADTGATVLVTMNALRLLNLRLA
jgi:Zn2+/Cd2+-exporting ATPase